MNDAQTIPAFDGAAVTPNDAADLPTFARTLYIGTGGDLKVTTTGGSTLTFVNLSGGTVLPVSVKRVFATGQPGTLATNIIALY